MKPITSSGLLTKLRVLDAIEPMLNKPYENHVRLQNNFAIGFNGVIAAGLPISENLECCPDIELTINALSKCGQNVAFTQLPTNRLSIKSDKFRALVPCITLDDFPICIPDAPVAQLDDRLKASISAASTLAGDNENDLLLASLLIHDGSVIATDRKLIIQHWHGIDLPPMLKLPKAIIAPLIKNQSKLAAFGYSNSSATFHYEDQSWIRTQFYADPWPDVRMILDTQCNPSPLPEDFFKGIKSLEPFAEDGLVYFDDGFVYTHGNDATYEIAGLPKGPVFSIKQLKMIEPYVKTIDFMAEGRNGPLTVWYGDRCRGAIAGRVR